MWVLVIFNTKTDEVEVCGLNDEEEPAKDLAQAYVQNRKGKPEFAQLRFAVTKIRPIVAYTHEEKWVIEE